MSNLHPETHNTPPSDQFSNLFLVITHPPLTLSPPSTLFKPRALEVLPTLLPTLTTLPATRVVNHAIYNIIALLRRLLHLNRSTGEATSVQVALDDVEILPREAREGIADLAGTGVEGAILAVGAVDAVAI